MRRQARRRLHGDVGGRYSLLPLALACAGCHSIVGLDDLQGRGAQRGWVRHFSGSARQEVHSVAIDLEGDVVVTGIFEGVMDFEVGELASSAGADIFVVKLAGSDGALRWATRLSDPEGASLPSLTITRENDIVLVGSFHGPLDLPFLQDTRGGQDESFALKLGPGGNLVWAWMGGGGDKQFAHDAVLAPKDNVIRLWLVGRNDGELRYVMGDEMSVPTTGKGDAFAIALDAQHGGTHLGYTFGDAEDQDARAVAADGEDIIIAGTMEGSLALDGCEPVTSGGATDLFLARLGPDGTCRYAAAFGDEQHQCYPWCELDLAVTPAGEVVLAGAYYGAMDLGSGTMVSGTVADGFVALFEPVASAGKPRPRWSFGFGDNFEQRLYAVALHDDEIVVSGLATGIFTLGDVDIIDETFAKDVVVAGIDLDGSLRWVEHWPNEGLMHDSDDRAGARLAARKGHGIASAADSAERSPSAANASRRATTATTASS